MFERRQKAVNNKFRREKSIGKVEERLMQGYRIEALGFKKSLDDFEKELKKEKKAAKARGKNSTVKADNCFLRVIHRITRR